MNCLFCNIINGNINSYKIYEDDLVLAFLDINPKTPGHTLIIPKKHFQDINDIEDVYLKQILKIAKKLNEVLTKNLHCDGITLMQNNGLSQEIKHFHLHLIPNYKKEEKLTVEEVYHILVKN